MFNIHPALVGSYQTPQDEEQKPEEDEEVERDVRVMKNAYTEAAETVLAKPRVKKIEKKKPRTNKESWDRIDQQKCIERKISTTRS